MASGLFEKQRRVDPLIYGHRTGVPTHTSIRNKQKLENSNYGHVNDLDYVFAKKKTEKVNKSIPNWSNSFLLQSGIKKMFGSSETLYDKIYKRFNNSKQILKGEINHFETTPQNQSSFHTSSQPSSQIRQEEEIKSFKTNTKQQINPNKSLQSKTRLLPGESAGVTSENVPQPQSSSGVSRLSSFIVNRNPAAFKPSIKLSRDIYQKYIERDLPSGSKNSEEEKVQPNPTRSQEKSDEV